MYIDLMLQKFDDNFEDFYDSEKDEFIIYAGKKNADFAIATQAKIHHYNKKTWKCWLVSAEYVPTIDAYKLTYKPY